MTLPPLADLPQSDWDEDDLLDDNQVWQDTAPLIAPSRPVIPVAEPRKVVQHIARKPMQPSARALSESQPKLALEDKYAAYEYPPLNLLTNPAEVTRHHLSDDALEQNARMLEAVLDDYGVKGEITSVRPGPVVTMYELEPAPGLKASRVIGLSDDIARSMSALSARVSTVPGRTVIGIELPNAMREKVVLREIIAARDFINTKITNPPNLSEVSKAVGLNEYKLKRGFKEMFNNTVFGYLTEQRLHLAHRTLLDTQKSAAEIATEFGYGTPQYFNNAFKKKFGETPLAIKKS